MLLDPQPGDLVGERGGQPGVVHGDVAVDPRRRPVAGQHQVGPEERPAPVRRVLDRGHVTDGGVCFAEVGLQFLGADGVLREQRTSGVFAFRGVFDFVGDAEFRFEGFGEVAEIE